MRVEMAQHYTDNERTYREELEHMELVHEDDECIIFADHNGYELNEWASWLHCDRKRLSLFMHKKARSECDYRWTIADPVVFFKRKTN